MGFEKECILNYRLFDKMEVPIWIETNDEIKSILAVCSNLAPNQIVPKVGIELSKALGWDLHLLYIVDPGDNVEVDQAGNRSHIKSEKELIFKGENY